MNSKIVSTVTVFTGLASLPLYCKASNFTTPFIKSLVAPVTHIDPSTWLLLCCGMAGLVIMRKFVR